MLQHLSSRQNSGQRGHNVMLLPPEVLGRSYAEYFELHHTSQFLGRTLCICQINGNTRRNIQ